MVLFKKLESFESTRPAVVCMNDFFKLALARQAHELENAPPPSAPPSSTAPPSTTPSMPTTPVGVGTAGGAAVAGGGGGGAHSRRSSIRA